MDEKGNPFAPYELQINVSQRKEIIAPLLVELRKTNHMSQRDVAALLGISPQTYNSWEKARNEPPLEHLVRLSYLYNVSMDTITGKNIFAVPTKENVAATLKTYRAQIQALQEELDSGECGADPERKQQLQSMLDGMRAVLALAETSNQ